MTTSSNPSFGTLIKNYLHSTTLLKVLTAEALLLPPDKEFMTPLGKFHWAPHRILIAPSTRFGAGYEIVIRGRFIDPGFVLFMKEHFDYGKVLLTMSTRSRGHSGHGFVEDKFFVGISRYAIDYRYSCGRDQALHQLDTMIQEMGRLNEPFDR